MDSKELSKSRCVFTVFATLLVYIIRGYLVGRTQSAAGHTKPLGSDTVPEICVSLTAMLPDWVKSMLFQAGLAMP